MKTIVPKTSIVERQKSAILTRAIQPENDDLSLSAARALLRFGLAEKDRLRLHELLVKNQEDNLTSEERGELAGLLDVGMLVDLLQAKARSTLHRAANRPGRAHG